MHGHETFGEPDQRLLTAATSSPVAFRAAPWRCGAALKENGVSRPRHSQAREETETPPSAASLIILHMKLPIIVTAHTGLRNGTHLSRARTSRLAQAQRRPERHPRFCWNATASAAVAAPVHPRLPFRSLPEPPLFPTPERQVRPLHTRPATLARVGPPSRYLGFTPMPGAQHFVRSAEGEPLAAPAAWKIAPRDKFIGAPPVHLSSSTTQGYCPGSESNILHPLAQTMFARRLEPSLRLASRTA